VSVYKTAEGVGKTLSKTLHKGDIILVKGSQNTIFLETVVAELMAEPEKAAEIICRQSHAWDAIREKYFRNNPNEKYKI
jgi:hypothetical protein